MSIEIKNICPLGCECEEIKNNKLHRCVWYVNVKGKLPDSEEIVDQWGCAMAWLPTLSVQIAQANNGQTQALESFRNESVKHQQVFNSLISTAMSAITQQKSKTPKFNLPQQSEKVEVIDG